MTKKSLLSKKKDSVMWIKLTSGQLMEYDKDKK